MSRYIRDEQRIKIFLKSGQVIEFETFGGSAIRELVNGFENFLSAGKPTFFSDQIEQSGVNKEKHILVQLRYDDVEGISYSEA